MVLFESLNRLAVERIFSLELAKVEARVGARGIRIQVDARCVEHLINSGYSEKQGARGIRRILEDLIENPLSEMILLSQFQPGEVAHVVYEDGQVQVRVAQGQR